MENSPLTKYTITLLNKCACLTLRGVYRFCLLTHIAKKMTFYFCSHRMLPKNWPADVKDLQQSLCNGLKNWWLVEQKKTITLWLGLLLVVLLAPRARSLVSPLSQESKGVGDREVGKREGHSPASPRLPLAHALLYGCHICFLSSIFQS